MANILPFDNATIDGVAVAAADFIYGSGSLTEAGSDKASTTADNRIHNIRERINPSASFEAFGDKTDLTTPAGLSVAIVLKRGVAVVRSLTGLVTATYNESSKNTSISISGDPESA